MESRSFPSRYVNLAAARRAHGDRVDRLGAHLSNTDELADRVVEAMAAMPSGEGWRVFERCLRGEGLDEAPPPMRALIEEAAYVPAWADWETIDRGGALLMRSGALGGMVLGTRSLVLGYASPGGNKPLIFSGRLKEQAARRLNETARFVQAVCRPAGMKPFAEGWKISLKVRLMHAQVRRMILATGRWNGDAWGVPINQHDMAGTTLLFSVSILGGLRQLGMRITPEEGEAYIHLWRWVGRTMGVDAEVLPASEPEAMRLADLIALTTGDPDDDSRALTRALFESAYDGRRAPGELRAARRSVMLGHVVCRELLGDELADKLAIPREAWRYAVPLMTRLIRAVERASRALPSGERGAVAVGTRYWDRVVQLGQIGAGYEFPLPTRLAQPAA